MPEFNEVENFPCEDDNLMQLKLYNWNPLCDLSESKFKMI
jgi:hypothetical protein